MITRDQFEAHVRAEAGKASDRATKCLSVEIYASLPKPVSDSTSEIVDRRIRDWKDGYTDSYIAARMEHEWPLVEALYGLCYGPVSMEDAADVAMDVLSPYTTKLIEP